MLKFVAISCFIGALSSYAADRNFHQPPLYVNKNKTQMSDEEMSQKFGPLPKKIDSLISLQTYAAYYSHKSSAWLIKNNATKRLVSTFEDPSLRLQVGINKDNEALDRIKTIFLDFGQFPNQLFCSEKIYTLLYPNPKLVEDKNYNEQFFSSFLMKNNQDLFPNYRDVLKDLQATIKTYSDEAKSFSSGLKELSDEEISKLLDVPPLGRLQRQCLTGKLGNIINDVNRLMMNMDFLVNNIDSIHVLDLYLFAEQNFDITQNLGTMLSGIIDAGHFFPKSTMAQVYEPQKGIGDFFHHRQMPMRSIFLMGRAVAFSLRDFAEKFRAQAGLKALPEQIFKQSDVLNKALSVNHKLLDIEDFLRKKHARKKKASKNTMTAEERVQQRSSYLSDTLINKNKSNKKAQHKKAQQKPKRSLVNNKKLDREKEEVDEVAQEMPQEAIDKLSIGTRVNNLLSEKDRSLFKKLFSLKSESLSSKDIEQLTLAIFRALVDQNKAHRAAEFIKVAGDARIFTKGKDEVLLSKESMEYRLLPYFLQNLIHPDFDKDVILQTSDFLRERVLQERIMLYGDEIDMSQLKQMEKIFGEGEKIANGAPPHKQRVLLVNLAHAWHKLAAATERAKGIEHKDHFLSDYHKKIIALLKQVLPLVDAAGAAPVGMLEAYLLNYYLKVERSPHYEKLTLEQYDAIQKRAALNMKDPSIKHIKTIDKVSPSGKKLGEYQVNNSIFHAVTNNELGDYIIVSFERPTKDRKIPLFIYYNEKIYRTDVFGGSKLKPNPKEEDFGSLIAVSLPAADFFKRWFTSKSSFWYGQRAFMPAKHNQKTKASKGELKVQTIPDSAELAVFGDLIVQDGFGYIKKSMAEHLSLRPVERSTDERQKFVAYHALHGYAAQNRKEAAQELFLGAKEAYLDPNFNKLSAKEKAQSLMCSLPKRSALGVPVRGASIILPDDSSWRDFALEGVMTGRNPYSAKRLQPIDKNHIKFSKELNHLQVFQYTLTGYIVNGQTPQGSFFKGLMAVIPDELWPKQYAGADILLSSKDQKLNQLWLTEADKNSDQNRAQLLTMSATLLVKGEYHDQQLIGLPPKIASKKAGDFDGDSYDVMPRKGYKHVFSMIEEEYDQAIPNAKINKPFIPRDEVGNFEKILDLRKPLNADWNNINNRFNYLLLEEKQQLCAQMAQSHILKECLGDNWRDKLDFIHKEMSDEDIVVNEIQLGLKVGEDAYKTDFDLKPIIKRDQDYHKALSGFNADASIPYGNGLVKKLEAKQHVKDAVLPALKRAKSANVVDKAFRGMARYLSDDHTYEDYVSDDEEEIEADGL